MDFRSLFIDKDKIVMANMELGVALNSLDEAIVLNQLNYWIERNKDANRNFRDGHYWVYNSYEAWRKQDFPVWSATKIKRIFTSLEGKGIVLSANYNKLAIDKTKWYTIDYDKLKKFIEEYSKGQNETSTDQDEISKDADDQSTGQNDQTLDQSERTLPDTNYIDYSTENTNRDLHTDTTKDKTLSNDNGEVKTSSSENQKKMTALKTNLQKYLDKKEDEQGMVKQLANICMGNYDEETAKEIFETIEYYFRRYTDKTGLIHPILTDKTLKRIAEKIDCFYDSEYSHFERLIGQDHAFMKMVDMFFDGDFGANKGNETNYHLPAFMTDGVLNRLGQRLFELGEVE